MFKSFEFKYLFAYTAPLTGLLALILGGWWSYFTVLYAFVIIPVMELFLAPNIYNKTKSEEETAKNNRLYDWLLYLNVPIHWGIFILYLFKVSQPGLEPYEWLGMTLSGGMLFGVGINIAHELGHRHKAYERVMSRSLLLQTLYTHFLTEHNLWHHRWVSTKNDPASAAYGEIIYFFWVKSIVGTYIQAWRLEAERLKREGKSAFSIHNRMAHYQLMQAGFMAAIYFIFGGWTLVSFLMAALTGVLLLETVNYIEHYGLRRKELKPGVYEPVRPQHSWNSDHVLGRILLYELTRHSDHHYKASRHYQTLRHFDVAPQMPTGYPGSMILSLFPPLWFYVMNKRVLAFQESETRHSPELAAA